MENPTKMDDLGGTTIFGNIHTFLGVLEDFNFFKLEIILPWISSYRNYMEPYFVAFGLPIVYP